MTEQTAEEINAAFTECIEKIEKIAGRRLVSIDMKLWKRNYRLEFEDLQKKDLLLDDKIYKRAPIYFDSLDIYYLWARKKAEGGTWEPGTRYFDPITDKYYFRFFKNWMSAPSLDQVREEVKTRGF